MMTKKYWACLAVCITCYLTTAQNGSVNYIIDWKPHNLVKYNRNLFNPTYSFVNQETRDISFWNRTQWVGIDDSPQVFLLNYSGRFGDNSGAGIGIYQQRQGLFVDSGLFLNYAYGLQLADNVWFTVGINGTGFRRGLNKSAFNNAEDDPALLEYQDDFFMVLMPGANLSIGNVDIGFYAENFFDYNFSNSDKRTDYTEKIFSGQLAYTFNFNSRDGILEGASLRTTLYGKNIPDSDLQYGANILFDLPRFGWLQAGYNETYGVAGGLGAKIFDGFTVGLVYETGTKATTSAFGATYEVTTTLEVFRRKNSSVPKRKKKVVKTPEKQRNALVNNEDEIKSENNNAATTGDGDNAVAGNQTDGKTKDGVANNAVNNTKDGQLIEDIMKDIQSDSINSGLSERVIANMDLDKLDSLNIDKNTDARILNQVFTENKPNSRYKAVERIDGVEYGFYLVANVYATKRYYGLFMKFLGNKGLEPKSFFNKDNNYYYVYLKKYDRLSEIEEARRTHYNNKYFGETWILWVRKN